MSAAGPSLTQQLAEIIGRPVAEDDRRLAAIHVEDWIGAVAAAAARPEGAAVTAYTRGQRGTGATAIGAGAASESDAAFHNAALAIALELDSNDREARLHAGPVVIAAALAAAEAAGAAGPAFLDAVVRGYDAAIRVGRSVGPGHYHYFHTTSTCGGFGAAAAVASVFDLDAPTTAHAMGLAGTTAGGFWQVRMEQATAKPVHAGRAAQSGVTGAHLAAGGMTAPRYVLEGERGLYAATAPDATPAAVTASAAGPWLIHETSLKPWACCRHAHAGIDAALDVHAQLTGERVLAVDVSTYADAIAFCDCPHPETTGQARFSLQHVVACALVDGEVAMSAFDEPARSRSDLAALRSEVRLRVDEAIDARYPASWGTIVTAHTATRALTVTRAEAKGDPRSPMTPAEVRQKTTSLLGTWVADDSLPAAVGAAVDDLADGAPVSAVTTLLLRH